jgi:hypothetical protein
MAGNQQLEERLESLAYAADHGHEGENAGGKDLKNQASGSRVDIHLVRFRAVG